MNGQEFLRYLRNPEMLDSSTLSRLELLVKEYPWFQGGWILYLKNLEVLQLPEFQPVLNETALRVTDRKWLKNFIENRDRKVKTAEVKEEYLLDNSGIPEEYPSGAPAEKSEKTRLIENFLEKGGVFKTTVPGGAVEEPVDLAARAVAIHDDIVTEKFANLLLCQSKYAEAISAFEKLSLKYPEKSIYFAARIEEVKKLMNVNNR